MLSQMGKEKHIRWMGLTVSAILIIARLPSVFIEPRFWAEEGSVHFAKAFAQPWTKGLGLVGFGYLALIPNAACTIAAHCFPLEKAPIFTTFIAFLVQLIPPVLVLWGQSDIWDSWTIRLFGLAIVLFTPLTGESWLNSINSQYFLSLATFLVLNEPVSASLIRKWAYRLLLLISGLTGFVSNFLFPLFIYRFISTKNKEAGIHAVILGTCLFLQLLIITFYYKSGIPNRSFHITLSM